jgi:hypothetical protein
MAFVRRRGNSYALIESYREGSKVKQRYVRTLTPAEAEALIARAEPPPRHSASSPTQEAVHAVEARSRRASASPGTVRATAACGPDTPPSHSPDAPSLETCLAASIRVWPPVLQERLAAARERTNLSLSNLVLGILYGWATRQ